ETLQRRLPQCIIIGEKKCGTRALLEYLDLHPDVVIATHEINYFSKYYDRGLEWYRSEMPPSRKNQITIEKTPKYFRTREVSSRVHAMNAAIRIILIVRDPFARSVSEWLQYCRVKNNTDICRTYEGSGVLTQTRQVNPNSPFISHSSFVLNIENWTKLFPLGSQFHVVDGDKLVSRPVSELEKIETFLGLHHCITEKNIAFNNTRGFYCTVSNKGQKTCLGMSKGVKHPTVIPEVEAMLRSYFKPLNQRFYRVVGRDFGW
ncbi:Heparan sulfate glucosamine 3-O-sulfotransferase 5, partial [Lamellibrachia satsuma]